MPGNEFPDIMTIPQAAEYLQLSTRTIRRLIDQQDLRASKVTSEWRIRKADIMDYLDKQANK